LKEELLTVKTCHHMEVNAQELKRRRMKTTVYFEMDGHMTVHLNNALCAYLICAFAEFVYLLGGKFYDF